jgi:hypothetical protein
VCECVCVVDPKLVCEEIMGTLLKDGFSFQVPLAKVEAAVMNVRGVDVRTVKRWIQVLVAFGYLEPVNRNVFQMNVVKVPHLASVLKNKPQTHIT